MSWLTTAARTTERTSVSTGKTVFLTMAALSVRTEAEREIPSWIAIQGSSPAIRNSGKLANPVSTGTRRIEREDPRVEQHPEDRVGEGPEEPEARAGIAGPDVPDHHLLEQEKAWAESRSCCLTCRAAGIIVAAVYVAIAFPRTSMSLPIRLARFTLVGSRIRELRKGRHLTQTELSEKIGIAQSDLSRMEQGEYKVGLDTLFKILQVFDLKMGEFFGETEKAARTRRPASSSASSRSSRARRGRKCAISSASRSSSSRTRSRRRVPPAYRKRKRKKTLSSACEPLESRKPMCS